MNYLKTNRRENAVRKGFLLSLIVVLAAAFGVSCTLHPLGSKQLSEDTYEQIVEGLTTKDEVKNLLGNPMRVVKFDHKGLEDYLTRTFPARSAGYLFPEGQ